MHSHIIFIQIHMHSHIYVNNIYTHVYMYMRINVKYTFTDTCRYSLVVCHMYSTIHNKGERQRDEPAAVRVRWMKRQKAVVCSRESMRMRLGEQ